MPSTSLRSRVDGLIQRATTLLSRLRQFTRTRSRTAQRAMGLLSAAVFIAAIVLATAALPDIDREIRWWPLVLVGIPGVPALMALNAMEYAASGRVVGVRLPAMHVIRVAIYARAANLLPLPGSILVRSQALKTKGSSYKQAFGVSTAVGVVWFAAGALLTGLWQVAMRPVLGISMLAAAAITLPLGHWMLRSIAARPGAFGRTLVILAIECAMILVKAIRFYLVMVGLDLGGDFASAVAITLSGVVASAFGFFPGGLGLREVLAAAIGPLVAVPAASALLATGIDRLIALPILALTALALALAPHDDAVTLPVGEEGPGDGPAAPAEGSDPPTANLPT